MLRFRRRARHARLIDATVKLFAKKGKWPQVREVQRALARAGDYKTDVQREVERLSPALGRLDPSGRIVLTVRGICRAKPVGHGLLEGFGRTVGLAATRYLDDDPNVEATLSHRDLTDELSLKPTQAKRLMALLAEEGIVARSSDSDHAAILPQVLDFVSVHSLRGYLKAKRKVDRERRLDRLRRSPATLIDWFRSDGTSIWAKIAVGTLSTAAGGILLAGMAHGFDLPLNGRSAQGAGQAEDADRDRPGRPKPRGDVGGTRKPD